jgi:hypothetical protein
MVAGNCCLAGIGLFGDWVIPEGKIQRRCGNFFQKKPLLSRFIATPIALVSGIVKVFLFPLICLVGVVVMPIIALIRCCLGKKDGVTWLQAWCFSILGVVASLAFVGATCFALPLIASSALLTLLVAGSIIFHVYKLVKEPRMPPPPLY